MKTQNQILSAVYKLAKASPIDTLSGEVYKKVRLADSELEDCVISLISGTNGKFLQDGGLYVKLFYKDIQNEETYYEDTVRGDVLEQLLWDFSDELLNMNGISFEVSSREIYAENVTEIHQHYVVLKLNYLLTIN